MEVILYKYMGLLLEHYNIGLIPTFQIIPETKTKTLIYYRCVVIIRIIVKRRHKNMKIIDKVILNIAKSIIVLYIYIKYRWIGKFEKEHFNTLRQTRRYRTHYTKFRV